jgi:hypothetical protein
MLRPGDIVFASFGRGLKTFKVRVAVLSVECRHAMLLASDGEVYGPARINALECCQYVPDEEAQMWRTRIDAHRAQNDTADHDDAAPVEIGPVVEPLYGPTDAPDVPMDDLNDEVPPRAASPQQQLCSICFTEAAPLQCEAGCAFCADCLFDYGSHLLSSRPKQDVLHCVCGDAIAWKTMASAWPEEEAAGLDRLVSHFGKSRVEASHNRGRPKELGISTMFDQLETKIPNIMAATQELKTPCCGTVFVDFDECFSLTCSGCGRYFCAWCMDSDSVFTDTEAAHDHVRNCQENPHPGAVYGDPMRWHSHCVGMKRERLNTARVSLYHKVTKLAQSVTDSHFYWATHRLA